MNPELIGSLVELQRQFSQFAMKMTQATEHGRGASFGHDHSGAIEIHLDDNGVARDIRVATDWRQRLAPQQVGAAVVAADTDAAYRRAQLTAELFESTSDDSRVIGSAAALATATATGRPRPPSELAGLTIAVYDEFRRDTTPVGTGCCAENAVRITLTHGRITECIVDARWLDRQDDTTLAHALRQALASAAAAASEASRPEAEFRQRINDLLGDVKATLRDISRHA